MKIVVLAAGTSTERDVSIVTSKLVCKALRENGHQATMVDVFYGCELVNGSVDETFAYAQDLESLSSEMSANTAKVKDEVKRRKAENVSFFGKNVLELCSSADMVFMGLHGSNGEDGRIQATFDLMNIRYSGTDYLSSAIAMNKEVTKRIATGAGVPMPKGISVTADNCDGNVGFPCVVKPCCGGSSVGVSIANNEDEYKKALEIGFAIEEELLVEEYVKGREFSVGVIDGKALPIIEIVPLTGFYDYENKYKAGATKDICPAQIPGAVTEKMQHYAELACESIGLKTYARVDFLMKEDESVYALEINTLPGMTPTSLLPQEAAQEGITYNQLCEKLIESSLRKYA